ncbi:LacI family DNA-binding transcriptional regulator [Plantactinospora sp. KLBMP9567]|uniref:LacI family DNA-binding transcriptional regulator n=1 Tax=Plantactinospora sp. KLBMP9567 TaxID=3085900 RepID=UPI00298209A9|nr:LacI family DNA-binding transcriptional regulator [Plantactinospora sp. KLBMP9567]MDW5324443.1 LacI family DNA-binding transcriptional regulator [Plantactinospora sp. KLBMP9567]
MTTPRRRATQVDIARRLGVSQATVSLVISGGPASANVAEQTRRAVLEAAAELGYAVNPVARSLKGGRNRLLGVFTFEPVFPVDQRDFYFPFLLGVEGATAEYGYDLLLFSSATAGGDRRIYAGGVNRLKLADGCVLLGRRLHHDDLTALLREDFPFVFIGRREVPGQQLSYVAADYVGATRAAVQSLVRLGHRRFAYLKATDDKEWLRDREAGFWAGLAAAGIPGDDVVIHPPDEEPADITRARFEDWLAAGITAVLVEHSEEDSAILAVERAAAEAGASIPQDCSVFLLGDPPLVHATARDWTRFSIPREQMGREAVRLLLELLDTELGQHRQIYLDCIQVPGDSVSAPPSTGVTR